MSALRNHLMVQPIKQDGTQELSLVERLKLYTAGGEGYITRCPVHHKKLDQMKQYEFKDGIMTSVWYLSGRCPSCSTMMRTSPQPNAVPHYIFG
jgi:hypothetical protein